MTRRLTLLLLFVTGMAPVLVAQGIPPPDGPRAAGRIEQLRKVRMIEALDLTEEQSIRFFARLHEHEKAKQALMDEKSATLDKLERLIRNDADDKEYRGLFPLIGEADAEIMESDNRFFEGLSDLLSESQRAKYLLFGRQFHRELQDALRFMHRRQEGL